MLTLHVTVGGIARKPWVVRDRIEIREIVSVTVSFDHDIVDGAPAARFTQRLKELAEGSHALQEEIRSLTKGPTLGADH